MDPESRRNFMDAKRLEIYKRQNEKSETVSDYKWAGYSSEKSES